MQQVQQNGLVASISGSTLWRWLNEEANRPWYQRSWVFPRDPDFATKAGRVLDLYSRRWRGCGLKEEESPVMMFRRGNRADHRAYLRDATPNGSRAYSPRNGCELETTNRKLRLFEPHVFRDQQRQKMPVFVRYFLGSLNV